MNLYKKLELTLKRADTINESSDDQAIADVASDLGLMHITFSDHIRNMVADEYTAGLVADLGRAHHWAIKHQYSVRNIRPEYPEFHESLRRFREEIDYVRETLSEARKHE